jgi:hypothetical protein
VSIHAVLVSYLHHSTGRHSGHSGPPSAAGVAFFFKQWGGPSPTAGGRLLGGRTWDQYPTAWPPGARGHKDAAR